MSGFYRNHPHDDSNHTRPRASIYAPAAVGGVDDIAEPEHDFRDFYDPVLSPRASPDRTDYYNSFYEAPRAPSPPHPSFLDNILNPAGLDHNRFSPFAYRPTSPPGRISHAFTPDMPPSTRAHQPRPARLPNGYVDLTSAPDSPPQRRKRQSVTPGPSSAKRQKREDGTAARREASEEPKIEEVDLTVEKESVQEILQKQREDAVKSQTKPEERPTTFNTFNCVICMDMPTDLTATACGMYLVHYKGLGHTNTTKVTSSATPVLWRLL